MAMRCPISSVSAAALRATSWTTCCRSMRMHANAARLERELAAIESDGMLDPVTGLFTAHAFLRELERAVDEARAHRSALLAGALLV